MNPHQNIIINHNGYFMKQSLALIVITAILSLTLVVGAHGNAIHVFGTVTGTTNDQVTVKTPKGEILTIYFATDTIFQKNGVTNTDARPKVGNRLIAEATKIEGKLVAMEVKFAAQKN